ncbi:hypothetical protein [Burkholderia anthina]|uniref:hypothetical protein n=1 Tax=Burkholderia anthina TaxID=179879 RepID=UPI001AA060BE|nr:hypothetical protein [Burkholderia anthina]QTD93921.1 hypothetical protein J4G50_24125 [Burkholderia anthina]
MKAGARDGRADTPPGFCLKNIEMKLPKKCRSGGGAEYRPAKRVPIGAQRPK